MKKVSIISKVIYIFLLFFVIRLFFSCNPYSPPPIKINYNTVSVSGIDNSGRFMNSGVKLDTIYSDAIAFKLSLADTTNYFASSFFPNLPQIFRFKEAQAFSVEQTYLPETKVIDIKVITLLDLNNSLKAGDDISEHILCSRTDDFSLYRYIYQAIPWLNGIQDAPRGSIILVLKDSVQNNNAQFEVRVTLDNGDELVCISNLFTIIKS